MTSIRPTSSRLPSHEKRAAMMTKVEVAQVVAYCEENKVSFRQRLEELGIPQWAFYEAKRKYVPKQETDNAGEFLQLVPGESFFPSPIKQARSRSRKQRDAEQESAPVNKELKTTTGTMMQISRNHTLNCFQFWVNYLIIL